MNTAFKEWALVCDALGRGDQSIILRKGGIAEGREGFRFKHDAFFLFPTLFHEQLARTVLPPETTVTAPAAGQVKIALFARVEWSELVTDWEAVRRLAPFHIWREEVVAERFHYDAAEGVHVAFLRVYRLGKPWIFPDAPAFGGCRSWLALPEPPEGLDLLPVLDDAAHSRRAEEIRAAVAGE